MWDGRRRFRLLSRAGRRELTVPFECAPRPDVRSKLPRSRTKLPDASGPQHNKALTSLNLSKNDIGDSGEARHGCHGTGPRQGWESPRLHTEGGCPPRLRRSYPTAHAAASGKPPQTQYLLRLRRASHLHRGPRDATLRDVLLAGAMAIGALLKTTSVLRKLSLQHNRIRDAGAGPERRADRRSPETSASETSARNVPKP